MNEINSEVIHSAAQGDQKAFKALYDHYNEYVWAVIYRASNGDIEMAKQIMQDVFVKVHRSLKKFRFQSAFSTWLFRITYTTSSSRLKKRGLFNKRHEELTDQTEDKKSFASEDRMFLNHILRSLSSQERFLLVAREVNNMSFDELAQITGKSEGALRTQVHRLKNQLRKGYTYE
ncbi:MAG: RNA polymerase sigma factor [Chitinispirillaceae bacterium]